MDSENYNTSMYSGKTVNETYSCSMVTAVSGSFYDHIKEDAAIWLEKIIQRLDQRGQIAIADYGTADGVGFLSMMNSLLDGHREISGIDIMIYLNDQPSNDFNLLIKGMAGQTSSNLKSENVSVAVTGRSMYGRCLPRSSLDICFSSLALHWLSKKPCNITKGLTYKHTNEKEERAFRQQAEQDWHQFLVNRGKELKKGGLCVILSLSYRPEDEEVNPLAQITPIWKLLLNSDVITSEEFVNTTVPSYIRRPEDYSYPFHNNEQELATLGLQLLSNNRIVHTCSKIIEHYSKTGDEHRKRYADAVVGYIQPWLRNTLYSGLSTKRSETTRNDICDKFFQILWKMSYRKEIKIAVVPFQQIIIQKLDER